jgi:hypothetical protein
VELDHLLVCVCPCVHVCHLRVQIPGTATACGLQCPASREIEHMQRRMAELEARVVMIEGMLDKRYVVGKAR